MLLTVHANMLEHDAVAMKRVLSRVICQLPAASFLGIMHALAAVFFKCALQS